MEFMTIYNLIGVGGNNLLMLMYSVMLLLIVFLALLHISENHFKFSRILVGLCMVGISVLLIYFFKSTFFTAVLFSAIFLTSLLILLTVSRGISYFACAVLIIGAFAFNLLNLGSVSEMFYVVAFLLLSVVILRDVLYGKTINP